MNNNTVRIALPSKGRMEQETLEFFSRCALPVNKVNPRQYTATIEDLPGVEVLFQRAKDIIRSVAAGDIDLGITGYDLLFDSAVDGDDLLVVHEALGYGQCELVLAVPDDWREVDTVADLAARAADGPPLRIATKHRRATGDFLTQQGLSNVSVVGADGALEVAPTVGYADMIADVTSTGTTLRENRLKPLDDGTIVTSEAILIGNRSALANDPNVLGVAMHLLERIEAYFAARGKYLVFANMRGESPEEIAARLFAQPDLAGLQGPTLSKVITREQGNNWWAVNLVVASSQLYPSIQQIRAIGGSGVVVTPATYIFDESPARLRALLAKLGKETS